MTRKSFVELIVLPSGVGATGGATDDVLGQVIEAGQLEISFALISPGDNFLLIHLSNLFIY
jgi:hypothetical protein